MALTHVIWRLHVCGASSHVRLCCGCVVATFLPELDRGFSLPVAFPVFVPYQLQAIDLQP